MSLINNALRIDTSTTALPTGSSLATPVRATPVKLFRPTFSDSLISGVESSAFNIVSSGTGQTVSQSNGNLVLTSGTTANANTILRSNQSFIGPVIFKQQTTLSQRIVNNNFFAELVDVIGDGLSMTVNSATSITVTISNSPFDASNIGQSMYIGAMTLAGCVSGRYAIASVSGDNVNFTVSGFPSNGTGTCSLFGWNYYQIVYNGTNSTIVNFDTQRRGWASGFTPAVINPTESPGHMTIINGEDGVGSLLDQLVASSTVIQTEMRASRVVNLPDEKVPLYLQFRSVNGSIAPASNTTWTIGMCSVENYASQPVNLINTKAQSFNTPQPVQIRGGVINATIPVDNPIPVVTGVTTNSWRTIKTFSVDTNTVTFNTRPASGDFVTISELQSNTQQLEIIAKIRTTPSGSYIVYVWIDDGTEIYCVSPVGGTPGENNISIQDVNGPYDGVAPVLVDLKRYTPSIRVAAQVVVEPAVVVMDSDGNCINTGFVGGENVSITSTGVMPRGLSANIESFNGATDTFTYSGASFTDGELLRFNYSTLIPSGAGMPPLGISACMFAADLRTGSDEIVLDGRVPNPFVVGDIVRMRQSGLSTFPTTFTASLTSAGSYIVTFSSGNTIKISTDGVQPFVFNTAGTGKFFLFKYPYEYFYMKGTNQLSRTLGGPAVDIQNDFNAIPVAVSVGQASQINPPVGTWVSQTVSGAFADNNWRSVIYGGPVGSALFVAVASSGTGNRIMTSPDGFTWTGRTSPVDNNWSSVAWSPTVGRFVAVSDSGTTRAMVSTDGITWTQSGVSGVQQNGWTYVIWVSFLSLFVAVASSGTGNRVMTSSNGLVWTTSTSAADLSWASVSWAESLNLLVAVAFSGLGNRVMTSPNGLDWTQRRSAVDNDWRAVAWSPTLNLFAAVASTGTGNRVMTSPDGINWTSRSTTGVDLGFTDITWVDTLGLFIAVSNAGTAGFRVATSPDGINWSPRPTPVDVGWNSICWSNALGRLVSVGQTGNGNRVMTSDASTYAGHGYSAGKELILTATTAPTTSFISQRFFVAANPPPSTYSYSLCIAVDGPAVAFTAVGAAVRMLDPATNLSTEVSVTVGSPSAITLPNHWLTQNASAFTLSGTSLPEGYSAGTILYVNAPLAQNTFSVSTNKISALVFRSTGTGVTLTSLTTYGYFAIEKTQAFVAQSPAPTNNVIKLANTASGPALTLSTGSSNISISNTAALQIKSGSFVKVRAI